MTVRAVAISRAVAVAAGLCCTAALADGNGVYIGGSIGQSDEHYDASTFSVRASNTGYKVAAGWRPLDLLAAEVDYTGFGRASGGTNYADTYAVGVSALGFLPIPIVDLYGRLGLINWRTNATSPVYSFHRDGANVVYGLGAGMHWGDLGARVEYEKYDVSHASTMNLASVGVTWTFL
jgi:hypothetical protein